MLIRKVRVFFARYVSYTSPLEIYFIDMSIALDGNSSNFFKKKSKQIDVGGGGFNPKKNNLYKKKFSEMYDGLIFVKNISLPTYNLITN